MMTFKIDIKEDVTQFLQMADYLKVKPINNLIEIPEPIGQGF